VQSGRHICKNTKYRLAPNVLIHTNYQEIKIQENAKALAVGTVPRSICVLLQDDLADMCQTGGVYADGCFVHKKVMERCVFMMSLTTSAPLKLPSVACR